MKKTTFGVGKVKHPTHSTVFNVFPIVANPQIGVSDELEGPMLYFTDSKYDSFNGIPQYYAGRVNGLDPNVIPVPFPRDGKITWETPEEETSVRRYTEGPKDRKWMRTRDKECAVLPVKEGARTEEEQAILKEINTNPEYDYLRQYALKNVSTKILNKYKIIRQLETTEPPSLLTIGTAFSLSCCMLNIFVVVSLLARGLAHGTLINKVERCANTALAIFLCCHFCSSLYYSASWSWVKLAISGLNISESSNVVASTIGECMGECGLFGLRSLRGKSLINLPQNIVALTSNPRIDAKVEKDDPKKTI